MLAMLVMAKNVLAGGVQATGRRLGAVGAEAVAATLAATRATVSTAGRSWDFRRMAPSRGRLFGVRRRPSAQDGPENTV